MSVSTPWHALTVDQALKETESNTKGLSSADVDARLGRFGANELIEAGKRPWWDILLDQFSNIMLLMLLGVAVVSSFFDIRTALIEGKIPVPKDGLAILVVVALNGLLGYLQEVRAEEALAALKSLSSSRVKVVRDGDTHEIDSRQLVPGDVLILEAGIRIPADGVLLEAVGLQVREAMLTGESQAVTKKAGLSLAADTQLGDRVNCVFSGTEIVQGRGLALVTVTGMNTELGKIASALQEIEAEPTPLQKRMNLLGNTLVKLSLSLVALVIVVGMIFEPTMENFEFLVKVSLSMAVAVVPEGLPAVITITLALGTQRMVKRHALIRRLPAVETLGSVTVICSDKTGTLTQNKMVVQRVITASHRLSITGEGYAPRGEFQENQVAMDPWESTELPWLLQGCLLCNDAILQEKDGNWAILGDPTEGALLTLAAKGGVERTSHTLPRLTEFPFTSERKRMSVICAENNQDSQQGQLFMKGSPELVLERCRAIQVGSEVIPLTDEHIHQILEDNNQLSSQGYRVLGFAFRGIDGIPDNADEAEQNLTWLGLVAMWDAARPEAFFAVRRCKSAGIRVVMITGDHQLTAQSIALELGITTVNAPVLTGRDLEKMTQEELTEQVGNVNVYARVAPEHKLRIVQALQHLGQVVAMTGDGVNDAPALKQADIGVAMGITGTDVSKEASDMVLLDDNFATIVAATEEGRVVYTNIRRFIRYLLGSNLGEVITVAASPLLGVGGVPLTPLQILWMNLVTDGIPALALAVEPGRPSVMQAPPKDPQESIFARGLGSYIIRQGVVLAIVSITLMTWAYHYTSAVTGPELDPNRWKTMVFTTLCLAQMGHAIAIRSNTRLAVEMNQFQNPAMLVSVTVTTFLQLLLIYVPTFRTFFGTYFISGVELAVCFGFSILILVWIDMEKLFFRWLLAKRGVPKSSLPRTEFLS
ncbi:MAG: cation-translocating P-type ATPase [Synechococcales cyanobacterium]